MASKKDMRRADLIVPYTEPKKDKNEGDMSSTMASTLPMAAIFTRNKMIGWVAVVFAIQSWLAESPEQAKTSGTPAYFSVGMSCKFTQLKSYLCSCRFGSTLTYVPVMSLLVVSAQSIRVQYQHPLTIGGKELCSSLPAPRACPSRIRVWNSRSATSGAAFLMTLQYGRETLERNSWLVG
ncbi:unnamed protein product [Periconia digitata]|uniref:Uncharacterized protein n=1 Tax=Periconia digitata TaxID=1303443 RepID=A0A9W4UJG9_9PLEO|nr:unnamed protein product [Periconia digitata]